MGIVLAILLSFISPPLGLDWGPEREDIPEVAEFRYWFGTIEWGSAAYLGDSDFVGIATELVIDFTGKKIARATLILHDGLNEANCILKYKEINKLLTHKYGPYRNQSSIRDPIIDDMIFYRECYALQAGLQEHEKTWHQGGFQIKSALFGYEGTIFIEIEYTKKSLMEALTEQEIQNLIKRL